MVISTETSMTPPATGTTTEHPTCKLCGSRAHTLLCRFTSPPPGETDFGLARYERELWRCRRCGHVVNRHEMDLSELYDGLYRTATYGEDLLQTYKHVMSLPPTKSYNRQRVERILRYFDDFGPNRSGLEARRVLDVGSGLGVFPAAMLAAGWGCVAIDPDRHAAIHAAETVGVQAHCTTLRALNLEERFDLVSFNKVLEHTPSMTGMLGRALRYLGSNGIVYVEVPDAEGAMNFGPDREEFFVEHYCAFSVPSLTLLARHARLRVELIERVVEPGGKHTLRAFLSRNPPDGPFR